MHEAARLDGIFNVGLTIIRCDAGAIWRTAARCRRIAVRQLKRLQHERRNARRFSAIRLRLWPGGGRPATVCLHRTGTVAGDAATCSDGFWNAGPFDAIFIGCHKPERAPPSRVVLANVCGICPSAAGGGIVPGG